MLYKDRNHKWVYQFDEGEAQMKGLLGGKGANLAEMTRIKLPIPPGFTITTEACNGYFDYGSQFPEGMWSQTQAALKQIETQAGKTFGDPANPLLVSVRSGARTSMPGMMDTVLNLGLNDATVEGLAKLTGNRRFALDSYRRLIAMFGTVVMGIEVEKFDRVLKMHKNQTTNGHDTDLTAAQLEDVIERYKRIFFAEHHGEEFPQDPLDQVRMAVGAVFNSWMGRRAIDYRRVHQIPDDLGTAVNIQTMVFGNLGWDCATGVAFTRNPSTGEKKIYGEYLLNAQGEDVVAGIRTPIELIEMAEEMPVAYKQFTQIATQLEEHYLDMQDIEFTIEKDTLYILQTRTGKRTGVAAVRIAVEMVNEKMIDKKTAILRVEPNQLEQLLHPMVDPKADPELLAEGLPASPGAAAGRIAFNPDEAVEMAEDGTPVILVRQETSPDDFHGMDAARAILTARGGMTSHAAVVARGMGTPCIVGANEISMNYDEGILYVGEYEVRRGDWITVDGSLGKVFFGKVSTIQPELDEYYHTFMSWADSFRDMGVRANADTGPDAAAAREFGAEGIGLCRTEHMFMGEERLGIMRQMILAEDLADRERALEKLLPIQRRDFIEIFKAMDGLPVTIRLLDPPLHEFLPNYDELQASLSELKWQMTYARGSIEIDRILKDIWEKEELMHRVESLHESNPMLGHRGCRLGVVYPEVTRMQAKAIFEAACQSRMDGIDVIPEIMIPLIATDAELEHQRAVVQEEAEAVLGAYGMELDYQIGTMIELPRAALTADEIAVHADFFSFGTNDLTQTTMGLSRDDSARFLPYYIGMGIFKHDPFQVLDQNGVGQLVQMGIERGRETKPDLKVGICGEHGGEPQSVEFCHKVGMDYVSCSPFRIPIARLAAAQAVLKERSR